MIVEQLVPLSGHTEVLELLDGLGDSPGPSRDPFHPLRVDFCDELARAIFRRPESRSLPDVLAAGFWIRRAAVRRLADRFMAIQTGGTVRVPRGMVFHLPPANVETLFIYPLIASFLAGNQNIVRVSRSRPSAQVALLCEALREVLADDRFEEFRDELVVISYGHESEPTAAISMQADVRLLWGGDQTIDRLRTVPITAAAHELTFGDRFSFAVLRPEAVLDCDDGSRHLLAQQLFNDAYGFDQMACSSPRLLIWVGEGHLVDAARGPLYAELARVIREKNYRLEPGASIAKLTFTYGALIDRPVESVEQFSNELSVLRLRDLDDFDRSHPGAGLFFEARVSGLSELVDFVERKDQTLTAHGFETDELMELARSLHGRGVDRIVGFGDALSFDSLWDGYDLLAELTRAVAVSRSA